MREADRVLVEDALKHLHECEAQGRAATLESVAGALAEPLPRATHVIELLQSAGLTTLSAGAFRLTDTGRTYALQVIRAHRLYETYLAFETGHVEADWHRRAHVEEHRLTAAQVAELSQRLGHPRFDPHGDPIPTADGQIRPAPGQRLTDWPVGEPARVTHIEDEPEAVYAQLVALGLGVGIELTVVEATPLRLVVEAEGQRHVLAPLLAANLTVVAAIPTVAGGKAEPLSTLPVGTPGRVINLSARCRGAERRRLLDLGVVPGTVIVPEMRSPVGDPTAYRVRETLVALRREQADAINVVRVPAEAAA